MYAAIDHHRTIMPNCSQMLSRSALRASSMAGPVARRGFHSTRVQMSSPYHYPEGPLSNIPFNPRTRFFWLRYTLFCGK